MECVRRGDAQGHPSDQFSDFSFFVFGILALLLDALIFFSAGQMVKSGYSQVPKFTASDRSGLRRSADMMSDTRSIAAGLQAASLDHSGLKSSGTSLNFGATTLSRASRAFFINSASLSAGVRAREMIVVNGNRVFAA